ncbi:MAG: hypothetical protein ACREUT_06805 [Steroidobacteraceae bacterium]
MVRTQNAEGAPIALFAYKRPHHVERLITSLNANELFVRSRVFVFCDGHKGPEDRDPVAQTRAVVRRLLGPTAEIIERESNAGLARSIITGVTELCRVYGRAIVLEDDLVLHPDCLAFMNAALRRYEDEKRIFHVNAYRYPIPEGSAPTFSRLASSWGWATWQRAWSAFEPNAHQLQRAIRAAGLIAAMDFGGGFPYYRMLQDQAAGKIDSWAIRWYASVLLRGGLAVCPNVSQVLNRGFDNSGVHCGVTSSFDVKVGSASQDWPAQIAEDQDECREMQLFFRRMRGTIPLRAAKRLKRLLSPNRR